MTLPVTADLIRAAARSIGDQIVRTPMIEARPISERVKARVFFKLENLQMTGSFKDRGALNKLLSLTEAQRRAGVVAMSAGYHAQGVAFHATRLGIPSTIVMPTFTPFTKVARTEGFGATVQLVGDTLDDSFQHAMRLVEERGATLIHPYDDPLIVAGQGTIGFEMLEAESSLDDLIVPIGGGGLISGIAIAAKSVKPEIVVTGVEAASYPSMSDAVAGRKGSYGGATIAEGIAVKKPGGITLEIVRQLVDDILICDEGALERGVHEMLLVQKIVAEGAGAAGLSALLAYPERFVGRSVGIVVCGGNIDARILSSILMRGLVRAGQLVRLRIEIEDVPGALSKVAGIIGACGGNIIETYHQRLFFTLPVKRADIDVVLETRDRSHVDTIVRRLIEGGFPTRMLTDVGG